MSDLKRYIQKRKSTDAEFAAGYEDGYTDFKLGITLRKLREQAGLTQEELAARLKTKKSAISRMENHAEDMRISTLHKIAMVLGKQINITIADDSR